MYRQLVIYLFFVIISAESVSGQVRIRLYADQTPSSAILTVAEGEYQIDFYDGKCLVLSNGEPVVFSVLGERMAVKPRHSEGYLCDSVSIRGLTGKEVFTLKINGARLPKRYYSGDLKCLFDLGSLVFINTCGTEIYIAGVVSAEGGPGRNIEYCKAQAILVRTYLYRNFDRHIIDNYNVCDNVHCQVFYGITNDPLINRAAVETKGLVVLDSTGKLIYPAFHSNCGGVTSTAKDVWLSDVSYLKKVSDPYCLSSPHASWVKSIPVPEWLAYLRENGFKAVNINNDELNFLQNTRLSDYRIGNFTLPFSKIRKDLNLRSSFFSVFTQGSHILLKGRGYGHGVGLCQEGAMVMAAKGFKFPDIIHFYFSGVSITKINTKTGNK